MKTICRTNCYSINNKHVVIKIDCYSNRMCVLKLCLSWRPIPFYSYSRYRDPHILAPWCEIADMIHSWQSQRKENITRTCCINTSVAFYNSRSSTATCLEFDTIDSGYIAVIHDTILHTVQQLQWQNFGHIRTHERHPIARPYRRAMGYYKRNKWPRDIESALYILIGPRLPTFFNEVVEVTVQF